MNKKYTLTEFSLEQFNKFKPEEILQEVIAQKDNDVKIMNYGLPDHIVEELKREQIPVPPGRLVTFCMFCQKYKSVWGYAMAGNGKIFFVMPKKIGSDFMNRIQK